jgi:hypothetical protein
MNVAVYCRWTLAWLVAIPALAMPYSIRMGYIGFLSHVIHLPLKLFGRVAHFLLKELNIRPKQIPQEKSPILLSDTKNVSEKVCLLYSGGSDSTCVAALAARNAKSIHLLTFSEMATRNSPLPTENTNLLKARYPLTEFLSFHYDIDPMVRFFSYENYLTGLWKHGMLILATCAYSSLAWHVETIRHCRKQGITTVQDGLTRELMHFPGHMDEVIEEFRKLYASFGIAYTNPVREWQVPPDQQFIDQVIVNSHASEYFLGDTNRSGRKTTGQFLYSEGIFPSPNVKGSRWDFLHQHECYPFALYNILTFWHFLAFTSYPDYCQRVASLVSDKLKTAQKVYLE